MKVPRILHTTGMWRQSAENMTVCVVVKPNRVAMC